MEFKADMHCHTYCSDGELSPMELLLKAKADGLQGLSITDHDTVEAYTEELQEAAKTLGIILCPGVEFSCQLGLESVHILGYAFDLNSIDLNNLCKKHKERRNQRNSRILKKLRSYQIVIELEELESRFPHGVIGRPHIALMMIEKGHVITIKEAFQRYLGEGRCCFDPGPVFTIDETLDVIHKAGGKAFLAHPQLIKRRKILKEVLKKDLDGIECYYGLFPRSESVRWIAITEEKQWLVSGGSDFHGHIKPYNRLGSSFVDRDTFQKILS